MNINSFQYKINDNENVLMKSNYSLKSFKKAYISDSITNI